MRNILYAFVFLLFFACSNNYNTKFSKEQWKEDTVSYEYRHTIAKRLIQSDSLFEWSKEELINKLGEPEGYRRDDDIEHLSYKFHKEVKQGNEVYAKYFDLYVKDTMLIRFDVIEWDTLTMYKRIYSKKRPTE